MGAMGHHNITVTGLNTSSFQGDRAIVSLLRKMGAVITESCGKLTVTPGPLHGIDIDARDVPDLIPVLAVTAACAKGITHVKNAGRLHLKESDRLASTATLIRSLGGYAIQDQDSLTIYGGSLQGGTVDACRDHRIVMAAAAASAACAGPVTILGTEAVQKSYPSFFEDYLALGGSIKEEKA